LTDLPQFARVERLELADGLSIASPFPALFVESEQALIVADTHLGIEASKQRWGTMIPYDTFSIVAECILRPTRELGCKKVFILGDLKHSFGKPNEVEWFLIRRLVNSIRSEGAELVIIRGNHDRNLRLLLSELGVKSHDSSARVSSFLLAHGHKQTKVSTDASQSVSAILIGHEHPAVVLRDEFGSRHYFKAFLHLEGCRSLRRQSNASFDIIVLPSVNPLAYGTVMNEVPQEELLSPYLRRNRTLEQSTPYVLDLGKKVIAFPKLSLLRS
jgi:putative SbcD/Mre11-related phosphoesterase